MYQHGVPGGPFSCPQHGPPSLLPFFHLKILLKSVKTAPWHVKNWNYEEEKAMWKTNYENNKKSRRRELSKALSSVAFGSYFTIPSGIQKWHYNREEDEKGKLLQINKFFPFAN